MKQPLVTIIIPSYNYEKYIQEAIRSAVNQSYPNIEVIVIDDGSTDNSLSLINELAQKHKFQAIHQENCGIIATRNTGVRLAKGDYLVQLDADDLLEPDYVEETVKAALLSGADIVYTQVAIFGRENFVTQHPQHNNEFLKHVNYIHASSLVSKKLFKNRQYDSYLDDKINEDWDLFLDACLDGFSAQLVDRPLLHYRKHNDALSRSDKFDLSKKEVLAAHHILSKQNAKHPEEMWYLSGYISLLHEQLKDNEELVKYKMQAQTYKSENNRTKSTLVYKLYAILRYKLHLPVR